MVDLFIAMSVKAASARIVQHISAALYRANEAPGCGRFSRNQPPLWLDCAAVSPIPTLKSGLLSHD
ncbi:hypothetical protein C4F51_06160 [Cellvibrio sp. KB43]|uniref:Uncharacterized protein n=1 Tax=Cellvibrio polysaccharolyticus TaxID=2082724 RepID=A0A928YV77_9GAMM|nr:hypothetical protein [Cellvibrio polysaccharolyticus]